MFDNQASSMLQSGQTTGFLRTYQFLSTYQYLSTYLDVGQTNRYSTIPWLLTRRNRSCCAPASLDFSCCLQWHIGWFFFFPSFRAFFFLRCFRITYHMIRWFQTLNMANQIGKKTIHFMASHKLLTLLDAKDEGWMPQALVTPPWINSIAASLYSYWFC